eukprot:jgi/Botrbrau1/9217/Bobra.0028s0013.1
MSEKFSVLHGPSADGGLSFSSWLAQLRALPALSRLEIIVLYSIVATIWAYFYIRPRPAGFLRFAAAVPIVVGNCIAPLLVRRHEEVLAGAAASMTIFWLTSFKVLQLCANRGPLLQCHSFPVFFTVLNLPILPDADKPGGLSDAAAKGRLVRRHVIYLMGDIFILGVATIVLTSSWPIPSLVREFFTVLLMYAFLSTTMDLLSIPAAALGLALAPHFRQPWLSSSFTELWGRRWNITFGKSIRNTILDPILEGRLVHDPKRPRAARSFKRLAMALCISFLVSGIMHEVFFWHLEGFRPGLTGMWFVFFAGWGPICVVERLLLSVLRERGLAPPALISCPFTVVGGLLWADLFFFPALLKSSMLDDAVAAFSGLFASAVGASSALRAEL